MSRGTRRTQEPARQGKHLLSGLLASLVLGGGLLAGAPLSCTKIATPLQEPRPPSKPGQNPTAGSKKASNKAAATVSLAMTNYALAIRTRNFPEAARLIDAATETERKTPEVRYARAIVALELNDIETALRSVDNMEKDWPLFSEEAKNIRLGAAKKSFDVTLLGHFLEGSREPEDLLLLAEAHAESSSHQKARSLADEALSGLTKSKRRDRKTLESRAHLVRASTLEREGKKDSAAKEYHWLSTQGVSAPLKNEETGEEVDFGPKLEALGSKLVLNSKERLDRARAFSERGLVEKTEGELNKIKSLSKTTYAEGQSEALLAWAFYNSRSDYLRASQLFKEAAARGGKDRKEFLYYEAKALARSHRDAEAIGKYETLAGLSGMYAEHAMYQAARLRFIDGQWKEATKGYEGYLKKYGKGGRHREAAGYDLPIARLAAKDYALAEKEISQLRKDDDDPRTRARLAELQAVALLGQKKEAEAELLFRKIIKDRPLSYAALLAAARLKAMSKSVPPPITPLQSNQAGAEKPLSLSLPEKVWRLNRVGLDLEAETALRAQESTIRAKYGTRSGEALCRLYGQLNSATRRYQVAQTAASWSVLKLAPGPGTEWQWDCIYPSPYNDIVRAEAAHRRVPPPFVYGIMRQESAFRPTVVSPAQAVGLMQIIPPTATRIAEEIGAEYHPDLMRAPAINIGYGTYYLRRLLDMFEDRLELAAASYNAGPHAVTRWLRAGETLPLDVFVARIPYSETRNYVYRVMGNYARYAYLDDTLGVPVVDLELPSGARADEKAY